MLKEQDRVRAHMWYNLAAAAAVSVVLLAVALIVLASLNLLQRRWSRHVL